MKIVTDESFGVIPYIYEEEHEPKFLLVHQHSYWRGDSSWTFPKGHAEEGETPADTALRELYEETHIQIKSLDISHPFAISYDFTHESTLIKKTVTFYLGEVDKKAYVLDKREIQNARWCTYEEAHALLTHDTTRSVLSKAKKHLV